jgi:predicted transglutaminase-like cysteine proteinase
MRLCLIALALSCAALPALSADSLPQATARSFPVPQAAIMAREHAPVNTCAALQEAYVAGGWPRGTGVETLKQIDSRVKQRMTLKNDPGVDTWTPLSAAILSGKRPSGDCDDLSVTTAQFAICAGMPADRLGLLITESPNRGSGELHMLAFYSDASDRTWVFGDTFGRPRALSKVNQRLLFFARLDHVTKWYALIGRDNAPVTSAVPDATASIPLLPETPRYGSCSGSWAQNGG